MKFKKIISSLISFAILATSVQFTLPASAGSSPDDWNFTDEAGDRGNLSTDKFHWDNTAKTLTLDGIDITVSEPASAGSIYFGLRLPNRFRKKNCVNAFSTKNPSKLKMQSRAYYRLVSEGTLKV